MTTDVVIVGGGPVGLAVGIEARLAGLDVTVIEPRAGPIDKACGEGLMPGAVDALARLGVRPAGRVFTGISYQDGRRRVDHEFRNGSGLGVRRTTLHEALAARAAEVGVDHLVGRVDALQQDTDSVTVCGIRARWLLACDGLHSSVRERVGLAGAPRGPRRFGLRRHFALAPWSDLVEVRWLADAEVYITPVAEDLVGVAVLGPPHTDYARVVACLPELAGAEAVTSMRGAGPLRQRTTRRTVGRILLVGDASGYVDAITGEGIRVGLAQARAAVRCIVAGVPDEYEREWRAVTRDYRCLTSGLVAIASGPLRSRIVPLARALPGVYGGIVERIAG